jgi:WYL domain
MRRPTNSGPRQRKGSPPAARVYETERRLCHAIIHRVLVELRYKDDLVWRTIAPYAVFHNAQGGVCLSCYQVSNPMQPQDDDEPRNFTVAEIVSLQLTDRHFLIDPRFNPRDRKYAHGSVICMVQFG